MPIERFLGKVILMTGATQGIGLEAARRVGLEGGKLVISSRQEANVKQAVTELRKEGIDVHGMTCHQGEREDRRRLLDFTVRKYGGIDAVFMSAGVSPHNGNILTVTEDLFDKTFDVNVKENFLFIQELVPILEKRGGGSIVTNSTAVACDYGMATIGKNILLYAVSKFTQAAMVYHVSRDSFAKNVRINCVLPGMIDTNFLKGGVSDAAFHGHLKKMSVDPKASRLGQPSEVGNLVAFLLSEDSTYINGESITCAGGMGSSRYC